MTTTSATSPTQRQRSPHRALAAFAGVVAFSAWAGAAGLVIGFLTLGAEIESRLPLDSPVLGGIALAVIVALPTTVLAVLAWQGDERTGDVALVAGVFVVGWIAVQVAFIQTFSFFQPTYVLVGCALVAWGLVLRPDRSGPRGQTGSSSRRRTSPSVMPARRSVKSSAGIGRAK